MHAIRHACLADIDQDGLAELIRLSSFVAPQISVFFLHADLVRKSAHAMQTSSARPSMSQPLLL